GAERDHLRNVARAGQLGLEQLGGIDLGVELGLEVEPGRMAEVAVGGAGEAIDAAMLAAPVGIDRLPETDIRAVVGGDDALGHLAIDIGLERGELGQALPAVVEGLAQLALEPPGPVRPGTAAAPAIGIDQRLPVPG